MIIAVESISLGFNGIWTSDLCDTGAMLLMRFHSSRETVYGLNKLASLPMSQLILVEHRTGNAEVTGSNPVEALIFSGFFFPIA